MSSGVAHDLHELYRVRFDMALTAEEAFRARAALRAAGFVVDVVTGPGRIVDDSPHIRGETVFSSKLTESEVLRIRREYDPANGMGYRPLAARYGVGYQAVRRIIKRETWAWLDPDSELSE